MRKIKLNFAENPPIVKMAFLEVIEADFLTRRDRGGRRVQKKCRQEFLSAFLCVCGFKGLMVGKRMPPDATGRPGIRLWR